MDKFVAKFVVKNDKSRGILIESISGNDEDKYYFKYHDQPLDRHCIQMQNIIRSAKVKRSRKIEVEVTEFFHEYYNYAEKTYHFKGTKLISNKKQFENSANMMMNKDIGQLKRKQTIEQNKQAKIAEHNRKLAEKIANQENQFQMERARRIAELTRGFPEDQPPTTPTNATNESAKHESLNNAGNGEVDRNGMEL